ncbi:peptidase inhibitor family I36 protein [Actinomadura formosensis]|uniref:peptidase inhibitor family I36 protein n=1 Tax=Actinomadura formosensis TaxID=60706 RepID=UPI003D8A3857
MTIGSLTTSLAITPWAVAAPSPDLLVQQQVDDQIRSYGGIQTGPSEVSYKGGDVKLIIAKKQAAGTANCPSGWYCFYQYKDWGGRRLQFKDCGSNQSLTDYGFGNLTTSWHNNSKNTVEVYDKSVDPFETLWRELPHSHSQFVGTLADNRADFFYAYCGK